MIVNDLNQIASAFKALEANQWQVAKAPLRHRKDKIKRLAQALQTHRSALQEALRADLGKPAAETDIFDLYPVLSEARHTLSHLTAWTRPQKVSTPTALVGSTSKVVHEPKGVVLIISPWNVPVNLTFGPLIAAIAAGNVVAIKPSEMTPRTSALMGEIVAALYPADEVVLLEGDVKVAQTLLQQPFNHIFFTGSPQVGRIVMRAAADHLASVTLELGGKCPAIVDESANLNEAVTKIVWSKFSNCGQTCIAPDYVLVHEGVADRFVALLEQKICDVYGATSEERLASPDLTNIINTRNFDRLVALKEEAVAAGATVKMGGHYDRDKLRFEPTLLSEVAPTMAIMQEELFGPLLPIIRVPSIQSALAQVRSLPIPLASYLFTHTKAHERLFLEDSKAGGSCINDCTVHFSNPNLPFGGANNSGIGKAHGYYGFEAFSNKRALLRQNTPFSAVQAMMPPYNDKIQQLIDVTLKWF